MQIKSSDTLSFKNSVICAEEGAWIGQFTGNNLVGLFLRMKKFNGLGATFCDSVTPSKIVMIFLYFSL